MLCWPRLEGFWPHAWLAVPHSRDHVMLLGARAGALHAVQAERAQAAIVPWLSVREGIGQEPYRPMAMPGEATSAWTPLCVSIVGCGF